MRWTLAPTWARSIRNLEGNSMNFRWRVAALSVAMLLGLTSVASAQSTKSTTTIFKYDSSGNLVLQQHNLNCGTGTTLCQNTCFNLQTDAVNCGSCGNRCSTPANGSAPLCTAGKCDFTCSAGYSKCGVECWINSKFSSDVNNCGACGNKCPADIFGRGATCSNGVCLTPCMFGTARCGTQCIDVKTDPNNCGGCGKVCALNQCCSNGVCGTGGGCAPRG